RESSNLYYYNVRFNNYAGNEAEIIKITGHKQRNLLPPGKALHVKFTTTKKHASVFRAIYADTGWIKFRVEATDIGKIQKVYVRHDNSGESPNWYLEKVNIRDKNGSPYQFNVNAWLDKEQADHVTAKLLDVKNPLSGHALCDVPCLNGGTCISPDSNKCACPDGYTGKYCDKPRCFPECMNGGQCIEGLCQCPLGHSGKYCEQVSICDIPSDRGPCFHEIFKAASKANKQNRTSACIRYLDDVLQSCTANNGSFTIGQCSKICEPEGEENVCKKIWEPGQCTSLLTKYTYDKDSGSCHPMLYNGCLGSRNSFDSIEECSSTCNKGYDFDFKYGQSKEFVDLEDLKAQSPSPRARRKSHRRKLRGKKKFKLPSTYFEPSLENIDEEKEIVIDPIRLDIRYKKMSSKHRERALESGSRSSTDDGRRFRHRHYLKREKAST
ncbi:hypothetical protein QZH41_000097, partial [Actinostola sp. cb2023]